MDLGVLGGGLAGLGGLGRGGAGNTVLAAHHEVLHVAHLLVDAVQDVTAALSCMLHPCPLLWCLCGHRHRGQCWPVTPAPRPDP